MWRNHGPVGEEIGRGQQPAGGGSGAELGDTVGTSARVCMCLHIYVRLVLSRPRQAPGSFPDPSFLLLESVQSLLPEPYAQLILFSVKRETKIVRRGKLGL